MRQIVKDYRLNQVIFFPEYDLDYRIVKFPTRYSVILEAVYPIHGQPSMITTSVNDLLRK